MYREDRNAPMDQSQHHMRIQTNPLPQELRQDDSSDSSAPTRQRLFFRRRPNPAKPTMFHVQRKISSRDNTHALQLRRLREGTLELRKHNVHMLTQ